MDTIGVIDNKDSLEKVLQEFEDTTGISPYIKTVYFDEWIWYYDELWEYAYSEYLNTFDDEQHFLIVYSEPENAEELDFVDWFWEGIQGDETDPILTESKMERFNKDLQDNFLRNNISVGEAFEYTFGESLTYMMGRNDNDDASAMLLFGVVWNAFVLIFVVSMINSFIISRRDYQEVPMEGSSNTVPGAMGHGNNTAYQNGTGVPYQNNTTFQNGSNSQNGQTYQNSQVYQSNANKLKKYMYYDKNGNKKYISSSIEPTKDAFWNMLVVLIIVIALLYNIFPPLWELILMIRKGTSLGEEIPSYIAFSFVTYLILNLALFIAAFFAIRRYIVYKNRDYVDVTGSSALDYEGMPNNSAVQYNTDTSQYNAAGVADMVFYMID
ncbi:MAG: hypothetical protein K2K20_01790, partial [Lachnospiraceae bacterium]|nr:hypothetical protein [Lachnospiraceae bacterium]